VTVVYRKDKDITRRYCHLNKGLSTSLTLSLLHDQVVADKLFQSQSIFV
jgi:hypothetical protein